MTKNTDHEKLSDLWNKKYIYKKDLNSYDYSFLPDSIKNGMPRQILWHIINNVKDVILCKCGNPVNWTTKSNSYRTFCSNKCAIDSNDTKEKRKQTNLEKYGSENPFGNKEIQEKIKQTNIEKYGVEHLLQSSEFLEKAKKTMLNRYGVENALHSNEIKEKVKQTNLEKYGFESPLLSDDIREKIKQTNIEKYGVENPQQNINVREKTKQTNIEKYGVEYGLQSPKVREKIKQTNLEKYGVNHPLESCEIQEKIKQTNLDRYGVENPFSSDDIREKIKQTNLDRYGVENPSSSDDIREKRKQTNLDRYGVESHLLSDTIQEKIKQTNLDRYGTPYSSQKHILPENLKILNSKHLFCEFVKDKTVYEITKELGVEETTIYKLIKKYDTGEIYRKKGPSYLETEMKEFLDTNNITYEQNNRTILSGKELDFYIPDYNIAIEMNGVYWHSDAFINDKYYHYNKWKLCNEKGIHLVSVFEDDWKLQQDKICNMLLTFFNKKQRGIPARKTKINKINGRTARPFLDQYHLQGYVSGTHYGSFDIDNNLIGIMTFGTTRNGRFELKRFVTDNYNHPGLFSKLFKYAQSDLDFSEVVSFSDNTCFTGNVYKTNGFKFISILKPDYRYLFNGKRVHKSNFKKSNIKRKFSHLSESISNGMSEADAMNLLGIPKVYDCGKCEWIWKI
jgi:endogenous inhibitor of DNA gyrase (YacG/DUF329 family)